MFFEGGKQQIFFEELSQTGSLSYDGVPFVIQESITLECQFGKDHHKSSKEKSRSKQVKQFFKIIFLNKCSRCYVHIIDVTVLHLCIYMQTN